MAGIRGRNTKPELVVRRALHRRGFRYRLHSPRVPGKPDMVLPAYNSVVFVHGCFWHGHNCRFFRWPGTRREFWKRKIKANRKRDLIVKNLLTKMGWRQLIIWECALRGKDRAAIDRVVARAESFLRSKHMNLEIRGP
jgi:DNA mismatch endonuclease (patch repair protein)